MKLKKGKGGGGGETSTTKIVLTAETDKSVIKEGDKATLTYQAGFLAYNSTYKAAFPVSQWL